MGTFRGHALPGCFFITFAIWWTSQITKRLVICETKKLPFYSSATYPCLYGRFLKWPLEGVIKIVATSIGIAGELYASTNYGKSSKIMYMGDLQHVTMYLFFCLSGIVDILVHVHFIPKGLEYIVLAVAFTGEGILFKFHLHGREPLDVLLHTLLLYAISACALLTLLQLKFPKSSIAGYAVAFAVLQQGTWFLQVGFILYNPTTGANPIGGHNKDDQLTIATMIFIWHLAANFIFMLMLYLILRQVYTRCGCIPRIGEIEYDLIKNLSTTSGYNAAHKNYRRLDEDRGDAEDEGSDEDFVAYGGLIEESAVDNSTDTIPLLENPGNGSITVRMDVEKAGGNSNSLEEI